MKTNLNLRYTLPSYLVTAAKLNSETGFIPIKAQIWLGQENLPSPWRQAQESVLDFEQTCVMENRLLTLLEEDCVCRPK